MVMPGYTKISWSDVSWNPVTGCTRVSAGCDHCYAETFAERWRGIPGHAYEQGFDLRLWPDRLEWPVVSRKPWQLCFTNSMSDLFHVDVPDDFRLRVFDSMRRAGEKGRVFQVLTKRADGMERWMRRLRWTIYPVRPVLAKPGQGMPLTTAEPLSNVWLGVSVESQAAVARARHLLRTPAAVRFLSVEPMLGPVDLSDVLAGLQGVRGDGYETAPVPELGWVILGGESGHGARPMDPTWALDVVAQCRAAGVPVFVKQLGSVWARANRSASGKGEIVEEWPSDLQIHEWPHGFTRVASVGKVRVRVPS